MFYNFIITFYVPIRNNYYYFISKSDKLINCITIKISEIASSLLLN